MTKEQAYLGVATSNGMSSFGIIVTRSANDRPDLYETVYLTAQPRDKADASLTQELYNIWHIHT
jgi:hypothetical protein